jgi:hypothetical protein
MLFFIRFFNSLLLKIFYILFCLASVCAVVFADNSAEYGQSVIVINPAGDAGKLERFLWSGYERGETFKCAEKMKKILWDRYNQKVMIPRRPGRETPPMKPVVIANQLMAKVFISLHIHYCNCEKPNISVFQLVYSPVADFAKTHVERFEFVPLRKAHVKSIHKTRNVLQRMKEFFDKKKSLKLFDFFGPYGIPLQPLAGVVSPAIAIDIGANNDNGWESIVDVLVDGIYNAVFS